MKLLRILTVVLFIFYNLTASALAKINKFEFVEKPIYRQAHLADRIDLSINAIGSNHAKANYIDNRVFSHHMLEYNTSDSELDEEKMKIIPRNPEAVFAIALLPGFFIHGLGHAYIGDNKTAGILFLTEAASVITLVKIFPRLISSEPDFKPKPLSVTIASISVIAFLASWQVDVWRAPSKAHKRNLGIIFTMNTDLERNGRSITPGVSLQHRF